VAVVEGEGGGDFEEQQVGDLLDVVAVADACVVEDAGVV